MPVADETFKAIANNIGVTLGWILAAVAIALSFYAYRKARSVKETVSAKRIPGEFLNP